VTQVCVVCMCVLALTHVCTQRDAMRARMDDMAAKCRSNGTEVRGVHVSATACDCVGRCSHHTTLMTTTRR
jgi:hypothetical protein